MFVNKKTYQSPFICHGDEAEERISLYAEGENFPVLWRQEAAFMVEEKRLQGAGKSFPKAGPTKADVKAPLSSIYLKADGKR